jgi:hypothetical protein
LDTNETKVFLSCSFREEDRPINELVQTVARGLAINFVNVAIGYSELPPEKAKEFIEESSALLAIISCRDKLSENEYAMPAAVREEISMAYYGNKPLLLIVEEGVRLDGFLQNYGTALRFRKRDISHNEFLYKLTASLYELRMKLDRILKEVYDFYAEYSLCLTELRCTTPGDFTWLRSVTKKVCFTKPFKRPLKAACWPTQAIEIPEDAGLVELDVDLESGSKAFRLEKSIERQTASEVEASLRITPVPSEDDFIVYTTRYKSKF